MFTKRRVYDGTIRSGNLRVFGGTCASHGLRVHQMDQKEHHGHDRTTPTRLRAAALTVAIAAVTLGLTQRVATGEPSTQALPPKPKPTHTQIQLLAINDFHGNLAPNSPTSSSGNINGTPRVAPSSSRPT